MDWNAWRRRLGVLVFMTAVVGTAPVWPQTLLPDVAGTWKPWKPFSAIASARQAQAATPALVKAFEAELLVLNAILRRAPGVASPVGYSVETWGHLAGYHVSEHAPGQPSGAALPLAGALSFGAFPIFEYERNGKMIREDTGETLLQHFLLNQIGPGLIDSGNVAEFEPVDRDAFLEPLPQGKIAGLPRYGDGLIIARDPAALWTPLSQRGALDLVVKARQLEVGNAQQSVDSYTAGMPDPQAFLKQIEEAIGIEEAALLKELAQTTGSGKRLIDVRRALSDVTDWIAELSPAELAAPACYAVKGATLRARFRTDASADCHPLVRPNYGYFDKALPRSAPQVVIITPIMHCFDTANKHNEDANSPSPSSCRANRTLIETLDKDAMRAWLR